MLNFSHQTRVFLFTEPVDMRKSFRGLCQLTESVLKEDPASGHWFAFINRRQDRLSQGATCGTIASPHFTVHHRGADRLSHGKVQRVMQGLFGIEMSRSASVKVVLRTAQRCEPIYQMMVDAMPAQPWAVGDETGWRIGGVGAWLHTFVAELMTCYMIEMTRGAEVAARILGWDYQGILIHDGWAPYDRFLEAEHQTCLAHLLRRCDGLLELATGAARVFPQQVKTLLQDALALRDRRDGEGISAHGLAVARGRLNKRLDRLLHWTRANPDNERLAAHLAKHYDQLFTFLNHPGIDATNWRAEHAIRPAVVNRKVWGGNRTVRGARAQSVLMSVLRTCVQQGKDAITFLS